LATMVLILRVISTMVRAMQAIVLLELTALHPSCTRQKINIRQVLFLTSLRIQTGTSDEHSSANVVRLNESHQINIKQTLDWKWHPGTDELRSDDPKR